MLNENYISIIIPEEGKTFQFKGKQVIVVQFKHNEKLVSQGFIQNKEYTWVPFDGIKVDVNRENKLYTLIDTENFGEDGFLDDQTVAVSYILGGGVWSTGYSKFSKELGVVGRISQITLESIPIREQNMMLINYYINYSVSDNYINKSKVRKSAFDFSNKMENSTQLEYTPRRVKGYETKKDYSKIYNNINKAIVDFSTKGQGYCNIL